MKARTIAVVFIATAQTLQCLAYQRCSLSISELEVVSSHLAFCSIFGWVPLQMYVFSSSSFLFSLNNQINMFAKNYEYTFLASVEV